MPAEKLPLLLFPKPTSSSRENLPPAWPSLHVPNAARQFQRLGPRFDQLQQSAAARRFQLSVEGVEADPDFVLVLETVGAIEGFFGAVRRTPGLEWLLESDEVELDPDEDFYSTDRYGNRQEAVLPGRLFLLGTNRRALEEIVKLWSRYRENPPVPLPHGLRKWKAVFEHLRDVRFWSLQDRLSLDVRRYWRERIDFGDRSITFEIEAWCFASDSKNATVSDDIHNLVKKGGGNVVSAALIKEVSYHGFLVTLPRDAVQAILADTPGELTLSEHIMFFKPKGQALGAPVTDAEKAAPVLVRTDPVRGQPVAALFDGLPLQNHPLLAGRLAVDDPDGFDAEYQAAERCHGTAMASLIVLGELDGPCIPIESPLYARPLMKPDPADSRTVRAESTPSDRLLIDLVHTAVRRLFEGEATVPTIKVINLSLGDLNRPFDRVLSPWARLLDWLSVKYQVLFVVSAGNDGAALRVDTGGVELSSMSEEARRAALAKAVHAVERVRPLLSPAESLNAITVGAVHSDRSSMIPVAGRWDLLPEGSLACYSRGGRGFRRSIKPDLLMPGGRALRIERMTSGVDRELRIVDVPSPPGHRVAAVPAADGRSTTYSRGTSNAAALATRAAVQAHAMLNALRPGSVLDGGKYDAVLLKALLVHGTSWSASREFTLAALDAVNPRQEQSAMATALGYGVADVERALNCTEQRATLIGAGELSSDQGMEFEAPLPPCLIAQRVKRRLTLTLAWFTAANVRHAKYRTARLWVLPPHETLRATRVECDWRDVRRGTVQHEILEGEEAFAFVDGDVLRFKVNCAADAGRIDVPTPFAICVSLEVAEGIEYPIYSEIAQRLQARAQVDVAAT